MYFNIYLSISYKFIANLANYELASIRQLIGTLFPAVFSGNTAHLAPRNPITEWASVNGLQFTFQRTPTKGSENCIALKSANLSHRSIHKILLISKNAQLDSIEILLVLTFPLRGGILFLPG